MTHPCPNCHSEMNVHGNTSECINPECDLRFVTLDNGDHERLTAEEIAAWGEMNRKLDARKAAK